MPERNGLIVFGTSAGATGTHAQHGRHRKSGSCNGFELHCLLLIDQIIIDKMMATTGTISLEWVKSGSMTATNAAAAPLADRESAFDSLRKFPFRFRCTYRLPKQITQSQVFCKIRKLTIFRLFYNAFKHCQHIESFEKRKPKLSFAFSDMMKMKKE